jgi:hypothetical protein
MPPVNYSPYKKVMPPGGIAAVPTEPVYMDPAIKGRADRAAETSRAALSELEPAALAQVESMKAQAEPWSSYIGRTASDIGSNLYNTVANASLWEMGKGIVTGAYDAATLPGDALTGKQTVINPDGSPNEEAIGRSFNAAGMLTLGSGAVPASALDLRMGTSGPRKFMGMGDNGKPEYWVDPTGNGDWKKTSAIQYAEYSKAGVPSATEKEILDTEQELAAKQGGTQLNMGLAGLWNRVTRSPEGGGGGGDKDLRGHNSGETEFEPIVNPPVKPKHQNNPDGSMRLAEVRKDGFYVKSEELMAKNPQKSGTAGEFVAFLRNKGVKKHEMEILGVDKLDPKQKMTREEFIAYLNGNQPTFKTEETRHFDTYTVKGGENYRMSNVTWENATPDTNFTYGTHYLPKNTLFHNRYKTMRDPDTGRSILRVEEAQSDWAQQGKGIYFKGYKPTPEEVETMVVSVADLNRGNIQGLTPREIDVAKDRIRYDWGGLQGRAPDDTKITMYKVKALGTNARWRPYAPEAMDSQGLLDHAKAAYEANRAQGWGPEDEIQSLWDIERTGLDRAPFVTEGSSGWVPLSIKDSIQKAVQGDHDEIVVIPGQVHADRWSGGGDRTQEGLKDFYDNVYFKEAKQTLNDIKKDYKALGVPESVLNDGLQLKVEKKKWIENEEELWADNQPDTHASTWATETAYDQLARIAETVDVPEPRAGYRSDLLNEAIDHLQEVEAYRGTEGSQISEGQFNIIQTRLEDDLQRYGEAYSIAQGEKLALEAEIKKLNERYNKLEISQNDYRVLNNDLDNQLYDTTYRAGDLERLIKRAKMKHDALPFARRLAQHWNENVWVDPATKPQPETGMDALTIKISPEMRDYIAKNGLSRFRRGGIVTLNPAAYA